MEFIGGLLYKMLSLGATAGSPPALQGASFVRHTAPVTQVYTIAGYPLGNQTNFVIAAVGLFGTGTRRPDCVRLSEDNPSYTWTVCICRRPLPAEFLLHRTAITNNPDAVDGPHRGLQLSCSCVAGRNRKHLQATLRLRKLLLSAPQQWLLPTHYPTSFRSSAPTYILLDL